MKKNGFTLIELLVVISIIAILTTIGVMTYQTVLKSGRDSKRQSDLRAIQNAIEQYRSDNGVSPAVLPDLAPASGRKYMEAIPNDPNPSPYPQYCYIASNGYELYAKMENPTSQTYSNKCSQTYNFRITPP